MDKSANLTRVVDLDGGIGYQAGRGGAMRRPRPIGWPRLPIFVRDTPTPWDNSR